MRHCFIVAFFAASLLAVRAEDKPSPVQTLIPWLLDEASNFKGIRFADVIAATSGKRVLPFDPKDADDQRVVAAIGPVLTEVLAAMNAPDSKTRSARRVNEMSSKFEDAIQAKLNALPGFACTFPLTATGAKQRSGYPDLRLVDKATGRIFYLDPKLHAKGGKASTFRTFYFEPKRATNKVNDDARHLIIGIEHEKAPDGSVRFMRWELIDLANFRVKLKAEFEGSNADMYRPDAVVGSGAP
jgi:hypothetical protein